MYFSLIVNSWGEHRQVMSEQKSICQYCSVDESILLISMILARWASLDQCIIILSVEESCFFLLDFVVVNGAPTKLPNSLSSVFTDGDDIIIYIYPRWCCSWTWYRSWNDENLCGTTYYIRFWTSDKVMALINACIIDVWE